MRRTAAFWVIILASFFFIVPSVVQAAPPANFQTTLIAGSGFNGATTFSFSPDGRIFILERTGKVKIFKNGQVLPTPFVDLPSAGTGDRGLIGIAFDPDYANNKWVYFWYTSSLDLHNRLVRFDASGDVAVADPVVLFETTTPSQELHVGGGMSFGPDGKIYLGVGDNGYPPNAQNLSVPFGKILRINKDGTAPADNPFVNTPGALPQVYAMGVRNPWRLQFDSASGRIFVGDVGNDAWEEVNKIERGKNYGWPVVEGMCTLGGAQCAQYTNPIYTYSHDGQSSAVTGGPVYHGNMFPSSYKGKYFVADYARGFIRTLSLDANGNSVGVETFDANAGSVVDMREAHDGSLYYITYFPARLYRISYSTGNTVPIANASADKVKGVDPLTVKFSSAGSMDPDGSALTYNWNFGDGTNSTVANPTKVFSQKGTYTVTLHVSDGTNVAEAIPLVIQVGVPPSVHIGAPYDGMTYRAGDTIFYTSSGIDGAGFDLHDADFTTEVLLHHDTHTHPFLGPIQSKTGTFTIPTMGEASPNTWHEIFITARDKNGLATTEIVNIYPEKSNISFVSDPPGLSINLDGTPVPNLPVTLQGVIGFEREIEAPITQFVNGKVYVFDRWSDGGLPKHFVTMAEQNTTYTAYYKEIPAFKAEYFNNMALSGVPSKTQNDPIINFDWQGDAPTAGINNDNFSVRWTRTQYFPAGKYTFKTTSDDGVRLYVDGQLLIDEWHDMAETDHTATITLAAGNHDIKVEYYDNLYAAVMKLDWTFEPTAVVPTMPPTVAPTPSVSPTVVPTVIPTPADNGFTAAYYNLPGTGSSPVLPTGSPAFTRQDASIDFNWGYGSPNVLIDADHFGVRWTKTQYFAGGNYIFNTVSDDGVKLFIDGELLINEWNDHGETKHAVQKALTAGNHEIKVEFYDNTEDAIISMWWDPVNQPTPTVDPTVTPTTVPTSTPTVGFLGEYWSTPGAGSKPAIPERVADYTRNDATVNFDWGMGSPNALIPVDHFVARWTGKMSFNAGTYRFSTVSDDGVRLYVDNILVFDQWNDHAATTHSADVVLTAGVHDIRFEYYENTGGAVAKLNWVSISGPVPTPTPTVAPTIAPTAAPTVLPVSGFNGEYWSVPGLESSPVVPVRVADYMRNDATVNFDWGMGSPNAVIPVDNFIARWSGKDTFNAGTYRFTTVSDDGIRVYVDNNIVIDQWNDHAATTHTGDIILTAGVHEIKIEFYEKSGGAVAKVSWNAIEGTPAPTATPTATPILPIGGFTGEYWSTVGTGRSPAWPAGAPALVRVDAAIDFDFGAGSPSEGIDNEHFVARWTGKHMFSSGNYRFTSQTDDGVRVYIDNELVIDDWIDHALKTTTYDKVMTEGEHDIRVEYYENGGGAIAKFFWNKL